MSESVDHEQASLVIQSHAGPYEVRVMPGAISNLSSLLPLKSHFIVDRQVAELYRAELTAVLATPSLLLIEATEGSKSLDRFSPYIEHLARHGARRGHALVAVGGGIIQDIVCFMAATLFRGLDWWFAPTTLLAQADSCIGSKSSVNVGHLKNILGTFTPPRGVIVDPTLLETLDERDVRSGYGEMLKVHAIAGPDEFDAIARDYPRLHEPDVRRRRIRRSLEIKRTLIEADEFDRGVRNLMNYGHTFGHAIEAATQFSVPHGIAVTMGADMANFVAAGLGRTTADHDARMHPTLRANYAGFEQTEVPLEAFLTAIARDKKNTDIGLTLILPDREGRVAITTTPNDQQFHSLCETFLRHRRSH